MDMVALSSHSTLDLIADNLSVIGQLRKNQDALMELSLAYSAADNMEQSARTAKKLCIAIFGKGKNADQAFKIIMAAVMKDDPNIIDQLRTEPWTIAPLNSDSIIKSLASASGLYKTFPDAAPAIHTPEIAALSQLVDHIGIMSGDKNILKDALTKSSVRSVLRDDDYTPLVLSGRLHAETGNLWHATTRPLPGQADRIGERKPKEMRQAIEMLRQECADRMPELCERLSAERPRHVDKTRLDQVCEAAKAHEIDGLASHLQAWYQDIIADQSLGASPQDRRKTSRLPPAPTLQLNR